MKKDERTKIRKIHKNYFKKCLQRTKNVRKYYTHSAEPQGLNKLGKTLVIYEFVTLRGAEEEVTTGSSSFCSLQSISYTVMYRTYDMLYTIL